MGSHIFEANECGGGDCPRQVEYDTSMNTMKINMCFLSDIVKAGLSMAVLLFSAAAGSCRYETKDSEAVHYDGEPVVYSAEGGTSFRVHLADDREHVLLILNGERYPLKRTISGSGARYANEDESIVYWNEGKSAFIQVDGEIVLDGREAVIDEQNLSPAALNQSQSQ